MQKAGERICFPGPFLSDLLRAIPVCTGDDTRMVIFHPIPVSLTVVKNLSAGYVYEALLHETGAHVFFVGYDAENPGGIPRPA